MVFVPAYFVLEDGTAKIDSNAYWDISDVIGYLTAKGVSDINNYTPDQQAQAIINSTMYIEKRFKRRYRGLRQTVEQALGWPRIGAFDDDSFTIFGVPQQIQWATAEYTIRALRLKVLAPDPIRTSPAEDFSQPNAGLTPGTATLTMTGNFTTGDTVVIGTRTYTARTALTPVDGEFKIGGSPQASLQNLINAINDNGGVPGTDYAVNQADMNVVASLMSPTQMLVSDTQPNANSVPVSKTSSTASWGVGVTALSGFAYNPPDPNLILGPVRTKTERVGPLEEMTSYDGLAQRAIQDERTTRSAQSSMVNDYWLPEYPEADLWIEQIIRNPATGTRLIRGS